MNSLRSRILIVSIFAIAMALLETAVVIYLREIMYPEGFKFPLEPIPPGITLTEILREAATLVMLVTIGLLAGKSFSQRFAWFIYSFAIWDIFYYVFLWVLISWPESIMTWDVLFLIPATWTGPVITPLILTVIMIGFAMLILVFAERGLDTRIRPLEWTGLLIGVFVLVFAFIFDYMKHMLSGFAFGELLHMGDPRIHDFAMTYIPESFPWLIYSFGCILLLLPIVHYSYRLNKSNAS